jgi:hypothetical protein
MQKLIALVLTLLILPASAASDATFKLCESEAFMSLNMARNYLLGGKKREAVTPYIGNSAFDQELSAELFRRVDSGEIVHHAQFATEKLYDCAAREGANLDQVRTVTKACFAKVDLPFFLYLAKEEGLGKTEAIARVERQLTDRELYPSALASTVAERIYLAPDIRQVQRTMRALFWSCMFP